MISYKQLLDKLKSAGFFKLTIKPHYFVITVPDTTYHVSIFKDQWDLYEKESGLPYYLFHISSSESTNRCSSYFWVDKNTHDITKIPRKNFLYEQPSYGFFGSTRKPCSYIDIRSCLLYFRKVMLWVKQ
jgi:hypothetical protein